MYGVSLWDLYNTPEQVQRFGEALASWPVEPVGGKFVMMAMSSSPAAKVALLQALACPQLQSAAWPKRVNTVTMDEVLVGEAEHALRSVFPAAEFVTVESEESHNFLFSLMRMMLK
jgi:hypothetical protein